MAARLGNDELNVVVTGGHLSRPDDFLLTASGEQSWLPGEKIVTNATHGTGCAFSSALLCGLISGLDPQGGCCCRQGLCHRSTSLRLSGRERQRPNESSLSV